jgi:hypothetical protein
MQLTPSALITFLSKLVLEPAIKLSPTHSLSSPLIQLITVADVFLLSPVQLVLLYSL